TLPRCGWRPRRCWLRPRRPVRTCSASDGLDNSCVQFCLMKFVSLATSSTRAAATGEHDNYPTDAFSLHSVTSLIFCHEEKDDLNPKHGTKTIIPLLSGLPPSLRVCISLLTIWKHSYEAPSIVGFRPYAGRSLPRLHESAGACPSLDRHQCRDR